MATSTEVDDILRYLERGLVVTIYSYRKKPEKKTLKVKLDTSQLIWIKAKETRPKGSINLREVKEIRIGKGSQDFDEWPEDARKEDAALCFVIFYGGDFELKTLSVVAATTEEYKQWLVGLKFLESNAKVKSYNLLMKRWLRKEFYSMEKVGADVVTFKHVKQWMQRINCNVPNSKLKDIFQDVGQGKDEIFFEQFATLFHRLVHIPEIISDYLEGYCETKGKEKIVTAEKFQQFLSNEQKETWSDHLSKVKTYMATLLGDSLRQAADVYFTDVEFEDYLFSKENSIWNEENSKIRHQNMTRPLSHYFIASSNRTNLLGGQISGESSVEAYVRCLRMGCRSVELECWEGPDDYPVIYRGHTLISKIKFLDVIHAIKEHAWVASDYPLILSIRDLCGIRQQRHMAMAFKNVFGGELLTEPVFQNTTQLPSPEQLRRKIILKFFRDIPYDVAILVGQLEAQSGRLLVGQLEAQLHKKLPSRFDSTFLDDVTKESDVTDNSGLSYLHNDLENRNTERELEKTYNIARELSNLVIYCSSVVGVQPNPNCCEMSSFAETKAEKYATKDKSILFVRYNRKQLSRIFPKGYGGEYLNYDPTVMWNLGSQLVALNYQTPGRSMQLNQGQFLQNGGCGYVLKPDFMLNGDFNPYDKHTLRGVDPLTLTITLIGARHLEVKGRHPFIETEICGMECDSSKCKMPVVVASGLNPIWRDSTADFKIVCPDLAFIRFVVMVEDIFGEPNFLGQASYPVSCLKCGYRSVPLKHKTDEEFEMASLLVKVDIRYSKKSENSGVTVQDEFDKKEDFIEKIKSSKPDDTDMWLQTDLREEERVLWTNENLYHAAGDGNVDEIRLLIRKGADVNWKHYHVEDTALHIASEFGREGAISALIANNADVNATNRVEDTPLHLASKYAKEDAIRVLLANNANVNATNRNKETPLHLACKYATESAVKILLDNHSDVTATNRNGENSLHYAFSYYDRSNLAIIKLLLECSLRPDDKDKYGNTLMHAACEHSFHNHDAIQMLLATGIPLDIKNQNGNTPLHYACLFEDDILLDMLIKFGFRSDVKNKEGKTPFDLSKRYKMHSRKISGIREEIVGTGKKPQKIFQRALARGKVKVFHIRIMIVGHFGVGKTTITKVLLGDSAEIGKLQSTDGIDIYVGRCRIDLDSGEWMEVKLDETEARLLAEKLQQLLYEERRRQIVEDIDKSVLDPIKTLFSRPQKVPALKEENQKNTLDEHTEQKRRMPSSDTNYSKRKSRNTVLAKSSRPDDYPNPKAQTTVSSIEKEFIQKQKKLLTLSSEPNVSKDFSKNHCDVEIWDFGGQAAFYTTHQSFLSPRCIYPLIIDGSKTLDGIVEDEELIPGQRTSMKVREYFRFWVNSIITYAKGKVRGFPKIIPILTHLDRIPEGDRLERVEHIFEEIQQYCVDNNIEEHIVLDSKLSLNATNPADGAYSRLRKTILEVARTYPSWGEDMPASWLPLDHTLFTIKAAGHKILPVRCLDNINKGSEFPPIEGDELLTYLDFKHSIGSVLYFRDRALRDNIILHPKWLIDALRSLITADRFYKGDYTKEKMLVKFSTRGVIEHSFIADLWNRNEYTEFYRNADHLLKTMEKLDLLSSPIQYDDTGSLIDNQLYFVPSMVKESAKEELIYQIIQADTSACLLFTFEGKFLPKAIFNRLSATCINMWQLEVYAKPILCSGFCCFRVDSSHTMAIRMLPYQILLSVTMEDEKVSTSLCGGIKYFVSQELKRICQVHGETENETDVDKCNMFTIQIPCCGKHIDCVLDFTQTTSDANTICKHHPGDDSFRWRKSWTFQAEDVKCVLDEPCGVDLACFDMDSELLTIKELGRLSRRLTCTPSILSAAFNMTEEDFCEITQDYSEGSRGIREQYFRILIKAGVTDLKLENLQKDLNMACDDKHVLCKVIRRRKAIVESSIKEEKMFDEPSMKLLSDVADRIDPKQAFQLFLEIELDLFKVIDRARIDFPQNFLSQTREIFKAWLEQTEQRATLSCLERAMKEVGINIGILREIVPQIMIPTRNLTK